MAQHSIYTIPPDEVFVDVLARALLERAGHDPMALARMRVLLPTRRAIGALRDAFLRLSGGRPMLLPHMQPIGDVDEEEMLLSGWFGGDDSALHVLPPVVPASRRILLLAQLVRRFHQASYGVIRMEQAVHLAGELAVLLDEIAREEQDIGNLKHIVPEALSEHWQLTLRFLDIITRQWPQVLAEEGRLDPVERRNRMLHLLAEHWRQCPPAYPVVAAGTTGSTPATAALLEVICGLPGGMVVLPALDTTMPQDVWETLGEDSQQQHPQYGMHQLLRRLGISREAVATLGGTPDDSPRVALLKAALLPAEATAQWGKQSCDWRRALKGFTRLDCATVQEEATAIALLLRDTVEQPGKTAALVTPNRALARRVAAVLKRFHVEIDDSAGVPLADMPAGVLLNLVSDMVVSRAAPVPLLALLKHPLVQMGMEAGACRHIARQLEMRVLRGVRLSEGLESISQQLLALDITEEQKENLIQFVERIANILRPFAAAVAAGRLPLCDVLRAHIAVAEAITTDSHGEVRLWQGEEGEQLTAFLHELLQSAQGMEAVDVASYPGILRALLAGRAWRPQYGMHPRLRILSPMEARLQLFDRVVLGGLNEGAWPMDAGQDPWMSRPMRSDFGLSLPERQIGLSAHDFYSLACAPEVVMTRAEKEGGSPAVPSRWLLRIEAMLGVLGGTAAQRAWTEEGARWCHWAAVLDEVAAPRPCPPPEPRPPLAARPRELYVTRIETLLRNPYGIYAQKVLGLKALDPLEQDPGAREFGTVVHDAIERYIKCSGKDIDKLLECGREAFADLLMRPAIQAFWWPRFTRIAAWLMEEEARRAGELRHIEAEQVGEMVLAAPAGLFRIRAKIDRLETLRDGNIRIIDYKTTTPPSLSHVERGVAAQMLLEAVMVQEGTIAGATRRSAAVVDMEYWHLSGGRDVATIIPLAEKSKGALADWVQAAREGVEALIAAYDDPAMPYRHAPQPQFAPSYDDYEHLSRVKEWGVEA